MVTAHHDYVSSEEFRTIIASSMDGFLLVDMTGHILDANDSYCRLVGYTRDQLLGMHLSALDSIDDAGEVARRSEEIVQKGSLQFETKHRHKDGSVIDAEICANYSPLHGGSLFSFIRDVSEKKRVERTLRKSEERYRSIVENQTDFVDRYLPGGILTYVNQALIRFAGVKAEELLGKSFYPFIHENDRAEAVRQIESICRDNPAVETESKIVLPDGRERWNRWTHTGFFDEQGNLVEYQSVGKDITDQKRAEEALRQSAERHRAIIQTAMDGFLLIDTQGRFLEVSETYCQMSGYNEQELLSMGISDLVADETPENIEGRISRLKMQGEERFESQHRRKDGSLFDVEVSAQYRPDEGGRYVVFVRDISRRKHTERELQKKNTEIEQFIYTVSHDLRSPLVTIKTFMGYLGHDISSGDSDRILKDIAFIDSAAERMKVLLDELLEISRIGRSDAIDESLTFQEIVNETLSAVAGQISTSRVDIRVGEANPGLRGDRRRLLQIWQNLLDNALKYMGDQTAPCIELGVELQQGETVFYVRDNGIGITANYHDKVFGIFEKLDRTSSGVGMGLTMVKRIVEMYGGAIRVESDGCNNGSCFLFTLPDAVAQS
jgi:PAS domain S-box-containing protein